MTRVFICYSRKDIDIADRLTADLNAQGITTWRDVDDIPGHIASNTSGWRRAVDEGLRQCTHMIVVLSPNSVESREVEAEWNYFLSQRRPVYPVLHRECDIPYRLMALQIWDLHTNYKKTVGQLAAALSGEAPAETAGGRPTALPVRLIGGAVLVAAVIALVVLGGPGLFPGRQTPTPAGPTATSDGTITKPTPDIGEVTRPPTGEPVIEEPTPVPTPESVVFEEDSRGVMMARIPPGTFTMGFDTDMAYVICLGSTGDCETDAYDFSDEEPIHTVTLTRPYWIDVYEVTNDQYKACVDAGVCDEPVETLSSTHNNYFNNRAYRNYPVIYVTWHMADTFCRDWRGGRLPGEAEWEYAARGGNDWVYPWGNSAVGESLLNFCDAGCDFSWADGRAEDGYPNDTSPVGDFPDGVSPFGLYDMAGNVWEWVQDWYGPYQEGPATDPTGPLDGLERVRRGGSWGNSASLVRLSNRGHGSPDFADDSQGFRCARTP